MRISISIFSTLLLFGAACAHSPPPAEAGAPVSTRMVRHPLSGAELPRIELPGRPGVAQAVNRHLDALAADLRCLDGGAGDYEASAEITHAANDVLSVSIYASYYCGGAHPVNGQDLSTTFDLRTGEVVRLRALFADYDRDRDAIAGAYLATLAAEDREGCEDVLRVETLRDYGMGYTLSPRGISLQPGLPHVVAACAHASTVPFDRVRALAAADGILARVADAAR